MVRKQIEQLLEETVNDPLEIFDSYHRFEAWIDKDYVQHQSFQEFWLIDREKFYRVHPPTDCKNHCVANQKNQMIWEYLHTHPIHRQFV